MSGFGGAVKLTGESEYKKALKQITQNLKEVSSEMKVVTSQFGKNDKSVKALTAKQEVLNTKLKEQTTKLNTIQSEYKRLSSQYETNTQKHNALLASYDKEKAELQRIATELGTSSKEYQEQEAKVSALEKEIIQSTKAQEANEKSMSDLRVEMNKAQADVNKTTSELDKLESQLKDAKDAEAKASTETEKLSSTIDKQEKELSELKTAYKNAVLEYGKNSTEAQTLAKSIEKLSSDLATNKTKMTEVDHAADELDKSLKDVDGSADKAGDGFTILKGTLASLASAGIQAVIDGLKNLSATAMETWREYDSGIDIVIAKTGATGKAAQELEGVFNSVSTKVVASQEDIGKAVGEVSTRFGVTGEKLDSLSTKFLKFAQLNNTDVNNSVDNTQKALSAFGLGVQDAEHVLDVFNKVGQDTGVSMDTLMSGLIQNGTAFQQMGLSIEQATVLMGQMEKSGANSETVMNGLRKALKSAASEGKPLDEALIELEDSIKNNANETEGLNKAYEVFGKSGDQIYGALKNGTLSFKDITAASKDFKGSVETTFENTQDAPEKFDLAIQGIHTRFGEMTDNLMEKYEPQIESALEKMVDISDKLFTVVEKGMDFFMKNGDTIITTLEAMAAGVGAYVAYTTALKVMKEGWMALTVVEKAVTAAQWAMNAAMSANPIGLIVAAIVALIAAFVLLWKKSEAFREFWKGLWKNIKKVASDVWSVIVGVFKAAWETIKKVWSVVKGFFTGIWTGIRNVFSTVATWFRTIFSNAVKGIQLAWSYVVRFFWNIWTGIRKVFNGVVGWFGKIFSGAWDAIKNVFKGWSDFFGGLWNTIKDKFTGIGEHIANAISKSVKKGINGIISMIEKTINKAIRLINGAIDLINKIPGVSIGYVSEVSLPRLARGGVLKKGQVGLLEGSGAEAVVPLEQNTKWIKRIADEMKLSLLGGNNALNANRASFVGDDITINVYASNGMDVNAVALAVEQRLARVQRQRQEVWT